MQKNNDNIHDAIHMIVELKYGMLQKINAAIREFEAQSALVVVGIRINLPKRISQARFTECYVPALEADDIEIQLIEL